MSFRLLPHVECIAAFTPTGQLAYHYLQFNPALESPVVKGPIIPWLNDQQRDQFLRDGLVEEIEDVESAPVCADSDDSLASVVDECVAALERLGVPQGAGGPTCRKALRDAGLQFRDTTIAIAVRRRKDPAGTVPERS